MKLAIATVLATFALAGSALAEVTVTATLDQAQPTRVKFIAADAVWDCSGNACVASIAPDTAQGVNACRELVRKVGAISAYGSDFKTLNAGSLERCNTAAANTATAKR
ncbi:MAG TPA: hypothetical protein VIC25_05660 [Caulobacteraceae bacterium]|jgi:hypothetical protein